MRVCKIVLLLGCVGREGLTLRLLASDDRSRDHVFNEVELLQQPRFDSPVWRSAFANALLLSGPTSAFAAFSGAHSGFKPLYSSAGVRGTPLMKTDLSRFTGKDRRKQITQQAIGLFTLGGLASNLGKPAPAFAAEEQVTMKRIRPTQFIAALGDPDATSGTGADKWGLWVEDPGPRGVFLRDYENKLGKKGNKAPAGWTFDESSWWVEEHGLIMETPDPLPLKRVKGPDDARQVFPQRRYLVTGGRETTSVLTVHDDGRWELDKGKLYDVTHLPCRSAIYTAANGGVCKPTKDKQGKFPVKPGGLMPKFDGCNTQDWAVLFVIGEEV